MVGTCDREAAKITSKPPGLTHHLHRYLYIKTSYIAICNDLDAGIRMPMHAIEAVGPLRRNSSHQKFQRKNPSRLGTRTASPLPMHMHTPRRRSRRVRGPPPFAPSFHFPSVRTAPSRASEPDGRCTCGATRDENGRENPLTTSVTIFFMRERERECRSGKRNRDYGIPKTIHFDR